MSEQLRNELRWTAATLQEVARNSRFFTEDVPIIIEGETRTVREILNGADAALSTHHAAPGAPQQEASGDGIFSPFNACMFRDECRSRAAATAPAAPQGMTIAGDGASMLGKLMREQRANRLGVYPDGNPNTSVREATAPAGGTALQALEALDELESSARGDEPFNHHAAPLIRQFIESTIATAPAGGVTEVLAQARQALIEMATVCGGCRNGPDGSFCCRKNQWDAIQAIDALTTAAQAAEPEGFYVASRASIPERPAMWRRLRSVGWPITSTWIDEAGEGETGDMGELWRRIHGEIQRSTGVLLYAEADDFPLKGALIECGIALGMGKPVAVVLPGVRLHPRSMKPLGSWAAHPLVTRYDTLGAASQALAASPTPPTGTSQGEGTS